MGLNPLIKNNWVNIQKKNSVPVNALGIKIDPKDEKTLKVWKDEQIDKFIKR